MNISSVKHNFSLEYITPEKICQAVKASYNIRKEDDISYSLAREHLQL